ncbi:hypothetical protein A5893_02990 [Pedobacter psychrophilus]|uniref:Uncharacterized protein n=1 Tax=Pedobacter psychrophilus TaxID=1826909 RepID=A0A179DM20_9SPHI|nr:hypothetical protein [Pedobacter psychrophilus]OAQ42096.1 hypothetical protein A5893_02990 [Pedobacter psychrophilus]
MEKIFNTDMHQELKRILLAMQPIRFKDDFKNIFNKTFLLNTNIPSFISDCPFNEATINSDLLFEDFVFPVMKDLTLIHSTRIDLKKIQTFIDKGSDENVNSFLNDFSTARDISMLDLCERNVACADLKYLEHIVGNYIKAKEKNNETPINLTVFNVIYRFEEYASR